MPITWSPSMTTGIDTIDAQHRQLIESVNALSAMLTRGQSLGDRELAGVLAWLKEYSTAHFAHEESCMDAHKCPTAALNRAAHAGFRQTLDQFVARRQAGEPALKLAVDLEAFLSGWLFDHLCNVDSALVRCARKHTTG